MNCDLHVLARCVVFGLATHLVNETARLKIISCFKTFKLKVVKID